MQPGLVTKVTKYRVSGGGGGDVTGNRGSETLKSGSGLSAEPNMSLRPIFINLEQEKEAAGSIKWPLHDSEWCQILGVKACKYCQRRRQEVISTKNGYGKEAGALEGLTNITKEVKLSPDMSQRTFYVPSLLASMMTFGSFRPVIPLYHHLGDLDKNSYYNAWNSCVNRDIRLPVITRHELHDRVIHPRPNKAIVNDEMKVDQQNEETNDLVDYIPKVPSNTPIPMDKQITPWPPIVDTWSAWNVTHRHSTAKRA